MVIGCLIAVFLFLIPSSTQNFDLHLTFNYTPPHATASTQRNQTSLHAKKITSRNHTSAHATTRHHTQPHVITRNHTQLHATTRNHKQPHATTRHHTQPHSPNAAFKCELMTVKNNNLYAVSTGKEWIDTKTGEVMSESSLWVEESSPEGEITCSRWHENYGKLKRLVGSSSPGLFSKELFFLIFVRKGFLFRRGFF